MDEAVKSKLRLLVLLWFIGAGLQVVLSLLSIAVSIMNFEDSFMSPEAVVYGGLSPFWTIANFVPGAIFVVKAARLRNWARIVMLVWAGVALLMSVKALWEFAGILDYDAVLFAIGVAYGMFGLGLAVMLPSVLLLNGRVRRAFGSA